MLVEGVGQVDMRKNEFEILVNRLEERSIVYLKFLEKGFTVGEDRALFNWPHSFEIWEWWWSGLVGQPGILHNVSFWWSMGQHPMGVFFWRGGGFQCLGYNIRFGNIMFVRTKSAKTMRDYVAHASGYDEVTQKRTDCALFWPGYRSQVGGTASTQLRGVGC